MTRSVSRKLLTKKSTKSWRAFQSEKGAKKRIWLGVLALIALILVIALSKLFGFIGRINESPSSFHWDGKTNVYLVLKSNETYFLSYNPNQKSLGIVKIPQMTYLNVPQGFGRWSVNSIYDLGQSEKPQIGFKLLKGAVRESFGSAVDGAIILNGDYKKLSAKEFIESLGGSQLKVLTKLGDLKTDLSLWDLIRILSGLSGVRFDKVTEIDLADGTASKWVILSDGTRGLEVNPSALDQKIEPFLHDDSISADKLTVAIYNATSQSGLGERAARLISNLGGRVILVSTSKEAQPKTTIVGQSSQTLRRLTQIFTPDCSECVKISSDAASRADIVITLGEDQK